jgi:DNA polymerase-3 subunit alpha
LEEFGWIKFDLLGLETLRIIQRSIELILKRREGIENPSFEQVSEWYTNHMAPDVIDTEDQHVYEYVYHEGRYCGIFQVVNAGAQRLFTKCKPKSVVDLAALTSIYRPGPLAAGVDKIYNEAKSNPEAVNYHHPLIKQVLEPTFGAIVFQEQIMQLCNVVAGFPQRECDQIRRALLKRTAAKAEAQKAEAIALKKQFVDGSVNNGVPARVADELFEKILFFSGYGFNACVLFDTEVDTYTSEGQVVRKQIQHVEPGDLVMTRDEATGQDLLTRVVTRHDNGVKELYEVTLDTGEKVKCTMDQKFRTTDGRKIPIKQILEDGASISTRDVR